MCVCRVRHSLPHSSDMPFAISPSKPLGHVSARAQTHSAVLFDQLEHLPWELATLIASQVAAKDLQRLCRVSSYWRRVAQEPVVWRSILQQHYHPDALPNNVLGLLLQNPPVKDVNWPQLFYKLGLKRSAHAFGVCGRVPAQISQVAGSEFSKVLLMDGFYTTKLLVDFANVPEGKYTLSWRIKVRSNFKFGFINFSAFFAKSAAEDAASQEACHMQQPLGGQNIDGSGAGSPAGSGASGRPSLLGRQGDSLSFLASCRSLLLGHYHSAWKMFHGERLNNQLKLERDMDGWAKLPLGSVKVRKLCSVHLSIVMLQMQPAAVNYEDVIGSDSKEEPGVYVDYVELQPARDMATAVLADPNAVSCTCSITCFAP